MSQKSIKKNYIYNVAYQILIIITPLITTPYVSRMLGADGIGAYSFTASIVAYFTMVASMGTARYGQREISYSQNDIERRTRSFWKLEFLSCMTTLVSFVVFLLYISISKDNVNLYLVQCFSIIAVAADISWLFQGMEEFGKIIRRNVIFKIINVVFIFLCVKSRDDLIIYVLGLSLITLLSNLSLWAYLRKYVQGPKKQDLCFWEILPEVFMLFIPSIAISIYTVLDKTMIGLITKSSFENGYYEQSLKISRTALTIVTSLGIVMVPRIGHHYFEGELETVRRYMEKSYRFVWFAGIPLCLGLCAIAPNLVPWFFGYGYDKVTPLLRVSSFLILAIGINNVTGIQYLIPTKRHNLFTLTVIFGAVVNFFMNYVLIHRFQSAGATIASVIAESAIAIAQLYLIRKELSLVVIAKSSIKYLVSGCVMFLVVSLLETKLAPSPINTLVLIAMCAMVYLCMLILMRDDFFIQQSQNIIAKIYKGKGKMLGK